MHTNIPVYGSHWMSLVDYRAVSKVLVDGEAFHPNRIESASVMFCRLTNLEQLTADYEPDGVGFNFKEYLFFIIDKQVSPLF